MDEPRRVQLLAHGSDDNMIREIARGLALLIEHVGRLQKSAETLANDEQPRGVAAVSAIADEEAAKYLILIDAVRCPRRAQKRREKQLRRSNEHLPKGIYGYVTGLSPMDLEDLRRLIKSLRVSHYLDGPNDVDWIFRNEIEARRERTLYVDYVETEDGLNWVAPDVYDHGLFLTGDPSRVVALVMALDRSGCSTERGLLAIADLWRDVIPKEKTSWHEIRRLNEETVRLLRDRQIVSEDFTDQDARTIVHDWTFPLHHEDLSKIDVDIEELKERQDRWAPD